MVLRGKKCPYTANPSHDLSHDSLDRVIEGRILLSQVPIVVNIENGKVPITSGIEFYVCVKEGANDMFLVC